MPDSQGPDLMSAEPWTAREIAQQPDTLRATQAVLREQQAGIDAFLAPILAQPGLRIMLAGAGTSAFIGECLAPWLAGLRGHPVEAVATTDIVSAPALYLLDVPMLIVSFGRSGTSPESITALDLADARVRHVHHLIITCNADGDLARRQAANTLIVVLPEATHDRGFAMTSSFTAMILATVSIFTGIDTMADRIESIAGSVTEALATGPRALALARQDFERVVYLGSGVLKGLAREAALKLLELTDGAIVTLFDTTMGFRHGPKTIVNDRTLIVVFVSNDPLTRRYDLDLIEELRSDGRAGAVVTIGAQPTGGDAIVIAGAQAATDVDLLFPFIVPAQLFALECSLRLGLTPDRPNASGTVSRVVQGVRIHAAA